MNKPILLSIIIILLCCSCNLIEINGGTPLNAFYSRYKQTNDAYPGLLIETDSSTALCELKYNVGKPEVYVINGLQLKQCLANYDDAIVYVWAPYCAGKECYSPSLLQKYCDEKNVTLFVVTEYYAADELVQFYQIERPLFGIDTKHYCSDFIDKYVGCFKNDLNATDKEAGRMLYFKKGKYMGKAIIEFEN